MTYPAWFALHRDPVIRRCWVAFPVYAALLSAGTFCHPVSLDVPALAQELGTTTMEIEAAVALLVAGGYFFAHPGESGYQYTAVFMRPADTPPDDPERTAACYRQRKVDTATRRGRERNAEGRHTHQDLLAIFAAQDGRCYYCSTPLGDDWHAEHKTPLARGGSNWPENMCCSCVPCNLRKHAKTEAEFVATRSAG